MHAAGYLVAMAADLNKRLTDLDRSLAEFDPSQTAPATSGQVFNALLAETHREHPGDAILYLPWDTALVGLAYPAPFTRLRDIGLGESPIASATLRGLPASQATVAARLRSVSRVWTVQWTPPQPTVGPAGSGSTALLAARAFRLVRRWRIESVFLSLYEKP